MQRLDQLAEEGTLMEKSPGKLVLELELLERWANFVKDVLRPLQTKYMHRMLHMLRVFGFHYNSVNEREWENLPSKNGIEPAQFWIPSPNRTRNGIRKHQKSGVCLKLVVVRNI
jgi:hypothetical protein